MSTPRALVLVLVLVLLGLTGGLVIGCGAGDAGTDGNSGADAGAGSNGCRVVLLVIPGQPIAGPLSEVRVDVTVLDVVGVPAYGWRIDGPTGDVPSLLAKPEGSAIVFTAASVPLTLTVGVPAPTGSTDPVISKSFPVVLTLS